MTGLGPAGDVHRARDLAQRLLVNSPERWRHTIGVARRAEGVLGTVGSRGDGDVLLAAAWLHDIGYAASLRETGLHAIDGARHLQALGWPSRIVALVAHHSAARCVAQVCGLAEQIDAFTREDSPVADALIYADQTVGPNGRVMSVEQRLTDMLHRHGPDSPPRRRAPPAGPHTARRGTTRRTPPHRATPTDLGRLTTLGARLGYDCANPSVSACGPQGILG